MIQVKKRMFVPLIMIGARNVERHYLWCSLEFVQQLNTLYSLLVPLDLLLQSSKRTASEDTW